MNCNSDRLGSKYPSRLRRAQDLNRDELEDIRVRLDALELGSGGVNYANFNLDGTTSETIPAPTGGGQWLIRVCNDAVGPGTHTLNFTGDIYYPTGGSTSSWSTSSEDSVLFAFSAYIQNGWHWYAVHSYEWV